MGRKKGPDVEKLKRIKQILRQNKSGLWAREIARKSGISKSTVHRYLTEFMQDEVEEVLSISGLVKMYKLK